MTEHEHMTADDITTRDWSDYCEMTEQDATQTQPQFKVGDRFFTHYDMQWGTVERVDNTYRNETHGVTGSPLPDTTWYGVRYDSGATSLLDDAHGNWDMARMIPENIAVKYGYENDPKAKRN
jgi:hypothetical protein